MKQIHYFNAIIILWLLSCNPQKKPIEPKIADVALTPPMGWNSYDCFGATAWTADVPSANDKYIALFNLGETESEIEVNFADLGIESECRVTDLCSGLDLGTHSHIFKQSIVPHGSDLYKFSMKD